MTEPIWTPSPERIAGAKITAFIHEVNRRHGTGIVDYDGLHRFSVDSPALFWRAVWDFCEVRAETVGQCVVDDPTRMPGARWFPEARLNFARNLLRRTDAQPALIALREDGQRSTVSFRELYDRVSRLAQFMRAANVGVGDRVAAYVPSVPDAVAAMLAATSLGAIWTCCSPEYGAAAAVERIGQAAPKLLLAADGYLYGGQRFDLLGRTREIVSQVPSITRTLVIPLLSSPPAVEEIPGAVGMEEALAPFVAGEIEFASLPFDHPAFILFSSGTTGAPKCIAHTAGGALLENLKSHALHFDVKQDDIVYMSCAAGWVVWNIMLVALGVGATVVLYDGSPFFPHRDQLVRQAAEERVTLVRWPVRYVEALAKEGFEPIKQHDLGALRTVMCSGSVFSAEGYRYVYERVKRDIHLVSPSGGTDSCGALVSSNPVGPLWAGEIQALALGLKVEIFDEAARPLRGKAGEMVVTQAFPSMPAGHWNDPDGSRYRNAYFSRFPNVWRHGDWAEITQRNGVIIHGRSDSTLNARGVRIGPAELYQQMSRIAQVAECVAVAQAWDGDSRVVLFVKLKPGFTWDESLGEAIRSAIRENLSPRHVPARIIAVPDIPVTVTGKVSEAAVHNAIHGREVPNRNALANPEALTHFAPARLPELQI
jgi:acetoacetyl-CoA synthetase